LLLQFSFDGLTLSYELSLTFLLIITHPCVDVSTHVNLQLKNYSKFIIQNSKCVCSTAGYVFLYIRSVYLLTAYASTLALSADERLGAASGCGLAAKVDS
jgi:hypothetical protein